ncbi:hypothetical protein D3C81_1575940 [compost metagenome]
MIGHEPGKHHIADVELFRQGPKIRLFRTGACYHNACANLFRGLDQGMQALVVPQHTDEEEIGLCFGQPYALEYAALLGSVKRSFVDAQWDDSDFVAHPVIGKNGAGSSIGRAVGDDDPRCMQGFPHQRRVQLPKVLLAHDVLDVSQHHGRPGVGHALQ